MKKIFLIISMTIFYLSPVVPASAHFGMIIPSDSMIMQDDIRTVRLNLSFSHPFESRGMELSKPNVFEVAASGGKSNLLGKLKKIKILRKS